MADQTANDVNPPRAAGVWKRVWRRLRRPVAESQAFKSLLAALIDTAFGFIRLTNPAVAGSHDYAAKVGEREPVILTMWHGQHLLGPYLYPRGRGLVVMFSKSADAELNALVCARRGIETVRGSGGRDGRQQVDKGGARALIGLKRHLDAGTNVGMIADIPHGTPRDAGLGIVTLAKHSGRPIVPFGTATSRRKVMEASWDKTTVPLPFGRSAVVFGQPVSVPADASDALMEEKRRELTVALDDAYAEAYRMVERR